MIYSKNPLTIPFIYLDTLLSLIIYFYDKGIHALPNILRSTAIQFRLF